MNCNQCNKNLDELPYYYKTKVLSCCLGHVPTDQRPELVIGQPLVSNYHTMGQWVVAVDKKKNQWAALDTTCGEVLPIFNFLPAPEDK